MLTSPSGQLASQKQLKNTLQKLKDLESFIKEKSKAVILGSSLFFTFARDYYDESDKYEEKLKIIDVTLIDMCHMDISDERDWGFIKGINECVKLMESIISIDNKERSLG